MARARVLAGVADEVNRTRPARKDMFGDRRIARSVRALCRRGCFHRNENRLNKALEHYAVNPNRPLLLARPFARDRAMPSLRISCQSVPWVMSLVSKKKE